MLWKSCRYKHYIPQVQMFKLKQNTRQSCALSDYSVKEELDSMFVGDFALADPVSKGKQGFDRSDKPFPFECLFKNKNRLTFEEPLPLPRFKYNEGFLLGAQMLPENHVYAPLSNMWGPNNCILSSQEPNH